MTTVYPGAIDALTNPTSTDQLASPSHSAQHANANDAIEAIETTLGASPFTAIRAERATSAQSIGNSSETVVVFNSISREDDAGGDFTLNTGTGVLTINRSGWYCIAAGIRWGNSGTGVRQISIRANATSLAHQTADGNATVSRMSVSTLAYLNATDTLDVTGFQTSGGSLDVVAATATHLAVHRVRG